MSEQRRYQIEKKYFLCYKTGGCELGMEEGFHEKKQSEFNSLNLEAVPGTGQLIKLVK
jgi:hypothetical protein